MRGSDFWLVRALASMPRFQSLATESRTLGDGNMAIDRPIKMPFSVDSQLREA